MSSSDQPPFSSGEDQSFQAGGAGSVPAAAEALASGEPGRPVWIWSVDGSSLIWANAEGLGILGLEAGVDPSAIDIKPSVPARRSLQAVGRMPVGGNGRGRIEILRISVGGHHETLVATCRSVDLDGVTAVMSLGTAPKTISPAPDLAPIAAPIDPAPIDPAPIDPAPLDPVPMDPAPMAFEAPESDPFQTDPIPAEPFVPTPMEPDAVMSEPVMDPPMTDMPTQDVPADETFAATPLVEPGYEASQEDPSPMANEVPAPSDDPFVLSIDAPSFDAAPTEQPATITSAPPIDDVALDTIATDGMADSAPMDGATAAASSFAFKPRSRPHRFSFIVSPDGLVRSLSSGLADAVGVGSALRDGDVAHQAVVAADPNTPHVVVTGLQDRERFSEHTVWWPIEGTELVAPVRLSAFGEEDGELRVFGTVATAQAEPRLTPAPMAPPMEDAPSAADGALPAEDLGISPLPSDDHHQDEPPAEPAAFAPQPSMEPSADGLQPTSTAMQFPGGSMLAEAVTALTAGFTAGLQRPLPDPVPDQPAVEALDDALDDDEATEAGLFTTEPTPVDAPMPATPQLVSAIDDQLDQNEAEAAGLWTQETVAEVPAASEPPLAEDQPPTDPPADEEVPSDIAKGMQAVAAGVAAGLGAGTLAALQDHQDDDVEPDATADEQGDGGHPSTPEDGTPVAESEPDLPAEPDPALVRPERLTFQEIARRLGARMTQPGGEPNQGPALPPSSEQGNHRDPTAQLVDADSDVELRAAAADVISLDPFASEPETETDGSGQTGDGRGSAQVLPFTRTEPNAERLVLDRLPLGVIIYSEDAILYANRAALEMAGLHSLQSLKAYRGIEALFSEGFEAEDGAMTLVQPNGTRVPVTGRLQSVRWDGQPAALLSLREEAPTGQVPAGTAALSDDTEPALGLVRARISELEAIVDLASDGVITLTGDGIIKDINQAAQALVGYSTDDLSGRPFRLLFAEDSRSIALDYLDDIASQGRLSLFNEGREVECLSAQGGLVPVFMTLGRLTDDEPATYCAVLRDLSPFKQAEDDLVAARQAAEEANAHKSDFLARVSHEIRTPLNAVIGFSEVMLEERFGPVGSERYRQYLRDIHTSGEHLMSLLNDLLDLSKIEAGKMDLTFGEVDLNDVAEQSLTIMQPQASQGRIIVRTSLPQSVPKVVADIRSIRQIVLNLISNAIKFTDPGGQIIVSTLYEPTGEVSLRVRDTGRGMSEADVDLAMQPFRQVPTTLNQVITGTGLGLPLTKALVEANKAQFALESTPGEGTLVKVTFPLQRVLAE